MTRIIIADIKSNNNNGKCTGHYYALADNYRAIFSKVSEVKIASGPIYLKRFPKDEMISLPCDCIASDSKLKQAWSLIRNCHSLSQQIQKDDIVIIQQSQPAMIITAVFLAYWSKAKLYQIQYSEEPMQRLSYKLLHFLTKWKYSGTICPNEKVGLAYKMPYVVVPDYFYTETIKICDIPYEDKEYDFAVVGRVEYEKGVVEVCKALSKTKFKAIVAGNPGDDSIARELEEICSKCPNIELHLRYITDEEYNNYLMSSRYCILNYHGSYSEKSSGVVLDTLFRGIPILGHRCRALQFVEENKVGVLCDDIESFDLQSLLDKNIYSELCASTEKFRKENSKFKDILFDFLFNR